MTAGTVAASTTQGRQAARLRRKIARKRPKMFGADTRPYPSIR
jgi:hypothetical protein